MTMRCNQCGYCCTVAVHKISPNAIKLAQYRENFIKLYKIDDEYYALKKSKCTKLRGNKCSIYDRRPTQCKIFPQDMKNIWKKIKPDCTMND